MPGDTEPSVHSNLLREKASAVVDCAGMLCPHPILEMAKKMRQLQLGQVLELIATDPNSKRDVPTWCQKTGNRLLAMEEREKIIRFYVKKGA